MALTSPILDRAERALREAQYECARSSELVKRCAEAIGERRARLNALRCVVAEAAARAADGRRTTGSVTPSGTPARRPADARLQGDHPPSDPHRAKSDEDDAQADVGSVWTYLPGGDRLPAEGAARAFGVVTGGNTFGGQPACVLLRLDRASARAGFVSAVLSGCSWIGRVVPPVPPDDAALVGAALELARARG